MSLNSCFYHPNLPAMLICYRCGRKICVSCSHPYNGLTLCPNCYRTVPAPASAPVPAPAAPTSMPVGATPVAVSGPIKPAGWYGPFPEVPLLVKMWWLPAAIVVFAAGLIFVNAAALLSPGFLPWSIAWITPWITPATFQLDFIIGIILGLVLVGALVIMLLKFRVLAAFLIFPTAILSLFIGGGFILGALLAVVAGILLLLM